MKTTDPLPKLVANSLDGGSKLWVWPDQLAQITRGSTVPNPAAMRLPLQSVLAHLDGREWDFLKS